MAAGARKDPVPVITSPDPSFAALTSTSSSASAAGGSGSGTALKQRRPPGPTAVTGGEKPIDLQRATKALDLDGNDDTDSNIVMPWTKRNAWIVYAVASGACAAFNGVFAKL